MDINIRQAVMQNLNHATHDDVRSTIEDAIARNEEIVLPGLGVLFELLYKAASPDEKQRIIDAIVKQLN
ncbi:MAG TPA: small acid-soluble spore protein SspI [Haloplasmataceae bacterium]